MKTKKISIIFLVVALILNFTACDGNSQKKEIEKTTKETVILETPTTSTEKTSNIEETTTISNEEVRTVTFDPSNIIEDKKFIFDYKEDIQRIFDGKEIKTGDIIDCREEIKKLGYDVNEYGKVFSLVYLTINFAYGFEILEMADSYVAYPPVDEAQNCIYQYTKEGSIKVSITYDENCIYGTFTHVK